MLFAPFNWAGIWIARKAAPFCTNNFGVKFLKSKTISLYWEACQKQTVWFWILIPFKSNDYGHVDWAHHGDGVERIEEVGEDDHVDWGLQPQVPDGLEHHGQEVHHVEGAEGRQQLIEEAWQLLAGEQEDGGNVPCANDV